MPAGCLYVIATPIGGPPEGALPAASLDRIRGLADFVAEDAKSARAFLATCGMPRPLREIAIAELNEHTATAAIPALLEPLRLGRSLGLLSEAGCAAVADPGAALVELAHRESHRVVPLVGPSSLLLALMASGLEGQRFAFCGYLPREPVPRQARIRALEARSRRERETQIFIETPYRNAALTGALLETCAAGTLLCVASSLTQPQESIATRSIAHWRRAPPAPGRAPTVYLLLATDGPSGR